ncbi:MAG: tetratricopeptide repeat protein, partial [Vibrionaceae bacterium]
LAQCQLGYLYAAGTKMNYNEAMHWFRQAAYQGNADAQYCLASMHANGCLTVVKGIWSKMLSWLRPTGAREDGNHDGLAADWLRRAAEQGHAEAQYALGMWYAYGRGVEQDLQQAYAWLSTAAVAGQAQAIGELARILAELTPAAQDAAKLLAASYLEKYLLKK